MTDYTKYLEKQKDIDFKKSRPGGDKKIGEKISSSLSDYKKARFVLVGVPQDAGVRRNKGRPGARKAPKQIRKEFYNFPAPLSLDEWTLLDLGDIKFAGTLEKTHDIQFQIIKRLIADNKTVIVAGGGNDISYPDARALHENEPGYIAFNIDSHLDVRDHEVSHSGTPYRQLLENKYLKPENFYEMAIKPILNEDTYIKYLKDKNVNIHTISDLRNYGIENLFSGILGKNKSEAIFWGIDMDSVRSSDAPGVSAPYPVGLSSEELCHIGEIAGSDPRSRILEISEVNPEYDTDNQTSRLAAMVVMHFISAAL